ncbi:MAG: hypothetical protein U0324_01215 [Polyangiales bacterium]
MSFFEKARTFFEASGMVTLDFLACGGRPPAEAALALADVDVAGRYRVTAQRECVVVRHVARVCSRLPTQDGSLGTVVAEEVRDAQGPAAAGGLAFPYTLRAGQSVEDVFHVAGVDLPAQLRRYGLEAVDPRVEFFVRVVVDVQGSPFDPEFELPLRVR